jgi:N-acyl amino acid synthase of PEP-CTERM/exosortase system
MNWNKMLLNTPVIGDIAKKVVTYKVNNDAKNIAEHFTQFLQPEIALTPALRDEVFRIRHNVYCEELGFEPTREERKEQDEFDEHSLFATIKHRPSNNYAGCVRIVRSTRVDELLPIEKFCSHAIQHDTLHPQYFAREEIGEISRLAVKAEFRRRQTDRFTGAATGAISVNTYSETELRCFPFIAIGLYMAAAALAIDTGVKHVFVMMEPRLARSMRFVGINFIQLGEPIEYHGKRAPYYINADIFMNDLTDGFKSLFITIEKDIVQQLKAYQQQHNILKL